MSATEAQLGLESQPKLECALESEVEYGFYRSSSIVRVREFEFYRSSSSCRVSVLSFEFELPIVRVLVADRSSSSSNSSADSSLFLHCWDPKMVPKWGPRSTPNGSRNGVRSRLRMGPEMGSQMDPKMTTWNNKSIMAVPWGIARENAGLDPPET